MSGVTAGSISAVITHPADVVKTLQETQISDKSRISTPRQIQRLWSTEGFGGLFKGACVCLRVLKGMLVVRLCIRIPAKVLFNHNSCVL